MIRVFTKLIEGFVAIGFRFAELLVRGIFGALTGQSRQEPTPHPEPEPEGSDPELLQHPAPEDEAVNPPDRS